MEEKPTENIAPETEFKISGSRPTENSYFDPDAISPETPEKSEMNWKKILIIVAISAATIGAGFGVFSLFSDTGINQAAAQEINFIDTGDSASAYNLMSASFKKATTLNQYAETIAGYRKLPISKAELKTVKSTKNDVIETAVADYTISGDSANYQLVMNLVKEDSAWKIQGIEITAE